MSGGFSLFGKLANATSFQLAHTPSSSANTKGSWSQITASLAHDCGAILVSPPPFFLANTNIISSMDLGVGAGGSEKIIAADLLACQGSGQTGNTAGTAAILLPISIPSGTRVASRGQESVASGSSSISAPCSITFFDTSFEFATGASAIDAIGFQSGSTQGTAITPGVGSMGSYAQLVASTSVDYAGFFACFDPQTGFNHQNYIALVDIAIGAAASEKIILPSFNTQVRPDDETAGSVYTPFLPIPIKSGTRIAARAQVDVATSGAMGVTLYGVRQ
jgi:hypothetical protein